MQIRNFPEETTVNSADKILIQSAADGVTRYITVANLLAGLLSSGGTTVTNTINRCLATNGATITASSTLNNSFPASSLIDGSRTGAVWGNGGGWNSDPSTGFPQWVEIDFNQSYSISIINVFTLQDAYGSPVEPTLTLTFSNYGVTAFQCQYWNGSSWTTIQTITGNNKVWTQVTFSPVTTNKIRIYVTAAIDTSARLTEIEAY